jgi:hypothetical protein
MINYIHSLVLFFCELVNSTDFPFFNLQLVLPEYLMHGLLTLLFLSAGEWVTFLFNCPLLSYHVNRYLMNTCRMSTELNNCVVIMFIHDIKST